MWCRLPGRGEFFSKGHQQAVSGTVNWARYEIPFYPGTVWLRKIELLETPLTS